MPDMNQIEVPQSFMALFLSAGRLRPGATQDIVVRRYELCEDMACMLAERAHTMSFDLNLGEEEVLLRCHRGLMGDAAIYSEQEAAWIIRRLAELLAWTPLDPATAG